MTAEYAQLIHYQMKPQSINGENAALLLLDEED
jgi:hypothetical protein